MPKAHSSHLYLKAACQACLSMTACPSQRLLASGHLSQVSKAIVQGSCQVKVAVNGHMSKVANTTTGIKRDLLGSATASGTPNRQLMASARRSTKGRSQRLSPDLRGMMNRHPGMTRIIAANRRKEQAQMRPQGPGRVQGRVSQVHVFSYK